MCGIAGIYDIEGLPGEADRIVTAMARAIAHRGGDEAGRYQNKHLCLAHERLSIIDLAGGRQPMMNEDKSVVLAVNGEIYNYQTLRSELTQRGHVFATTSDSEVLVHLYEDFGLTMFDKINGIFAFALWDGRRRRLLLARDHMGVKPLHIYRNKNRIFFASEVKAILAAPGVTPQMNKQSVHYFMNLRYVPGRDTLFKGVQRILPGEYLVVDKNGSRHHRYWRIPSPGGHRITEKAAATGLRQHLFSAVQRQMIADVPVGVYLSGGIDSSSVLAMARQVEKNEINTYALGFNEPTDELDDARQVARHFNTNHHPFSIDPSPLQRLPQVLWHVEEPKINMIQGFLLAGHARQFTKVALSGLGGDELFAGYLAYQFLKPAELYHQIFLRPFLDRFHAMMSAVAGKSKWRPKGLAMDEYRRGIHLSASLGDKCQYYCIIRNVWDHCSDLWPVLYGPRMLEHELNPTRNIFDSYFADGKQSFVEQALTAEMETKLVDDFLLNEDRVSMAHALEVRVPLLDRDLVTFASRLPIAMKMSGMQTKYIFKKAMQGLLPQFVLDKKKWGFTFNAYIQYQKDLKNAVQTILTPQKVRDLGLFNYGFIASVLRHPPHPRLRWHYFTLWMMVGFHVWHDLFVQKNGFMKRG